ncbi:MAG: aminotransferase class III-fold pyridoxal phosphate-dependent enzyme [Deltaproteobacteria bacterium]|nr:aminotransferase class III-fold pyridoxal phosphate-dependent enzyme [Deltaproteobacteria bacterium]
MPRSLEVFEVIRSPGGAAPCLLRFQNFADLLFGRADGGSDAEPVIMGTIDEGGVRVSLRALRHATLGLIADLSRRGVKPGDTVCVLRLPRTSETLVALSLVALSAWGVRVFLPMYIECDRLEAWLKASGSKLLLWNAHEVEDLVKHEADLALLGRLRAMARTLGIPALCLQGDLNLGARAVETHEESPPASDPLIATLMGATSAETEALLLTTSGTSGRARLVRYAQGAFLRSAASWEAAGLLGEDRLGNRGLSLLLGHSMGVRALWNALWTRKPLCLLTPERVIEHPGRVRDLLLEMRPEHVLAGPATYRALLELARVFPQLKETCFQDLKCLVSNGAPYDGSLAKRLHVALGLPLENALGTTETQMIACTLVGGPHEPGSLGSPLPGVELGLAPEPSQGEGVFRLWARSPFASLGYLAHEDSAAQGGNFPGPGGFMDTGDLVVKSKAGLKYFARAKGDFVKDSFGVKVSRGRLEELYGGLMPPVAHVECFPLREEPGLAALVFLLGEHAPEAGCLVTARAILSSVQGQLEARHEHFLDSLEEFEFRHLTIKRFACVRDQVPRTRKGSVVRSEIDRRYGPLLANLCGPYSKRAGIVLLPEEHFFQPTHVRLASPRRGALLRSTRMDKHYVSGKGDRLVFLDGSRPIEVLDAVGGFGGNLLGHSHEAVREAASAALEDDSVLFWDQGAARPEQGELARKLALKVAETTGQAYVVRFGSTGSEAVEMAISHAALERNERWRRIARDQKRRFGGAQPELVSHCLAEAERILGASRLALIALEGAFHGHSLGARAVLGNARKRAPYESLMGIETRFVPRSGEIDLDALVCEYTACVPILVPRGHGAALGTLSFVNVVAAIAEPIQGEGGVTEIDPRLLARLGGYEFPLILDEIQSGLGRVGTFLASEGVRGHYYLFGKALGGGAAKISALLVERSRYLDRFDEHYSSTFGGDPFSCRVARRVLDVIEREDIPRRARERGEALKAALVGLAHEYPDVIERVSGRGLLLGIKLAPKATEDSLVLRALETHDLLGAVASAFLLHEHHVRILPTLSAPSTLRIQPSAFLDSHGQDQLVNALRGLCDVLVRRDLGVLLRGILPREDLAEQDRFPAQALPRFSGRVERPAEGAARVAFISHFALPEREIAMAEPSLAALGRGALRALFQRLTTFLELKPILGFSRNLFGGRLWFVSIVIPADAAFLEERLRRNYRYLETERLQDAVNLAASLGCGHVALGGYTSILARDGLALLPPDGVRITSGNSFTVAVAARRLQGACAGMGVAVGDAVLGVVGATGNIGSALVHKLVTGLPRPGRVVLLGRDQRRLAALRDQVLSEVGRGAGGAIDVQVGTDLHLLRACHVVTVATSTNEPLVFPHHLATGHPVLIADVSVPSAVSPLVQGMPNVRVVPFAGTVAVPSAPDFVVSSHTPEGSTFCCAAEVMLLGLAPEETRDLRLVGDIDPQSVAALDALGERLGFYAALGGGGFRASAASMVSKEE